MAMNVTSRNAAGNMVVKTVLCCDTDACMRRAYEKSL